jgi:capsular exopolysaccharide synthesis family protein
MLNDRQLSVSDLGRDLTKPSEIKDANPIATQVELARSERVLEQALAQVSSQRMNGLPPLKKFKKDLKVSIVPATGILEMTYRSQNPLLTSSLLNAVSEVMVKENAEAFRSDARSVRKFLETDLPKKRAELAQAEAAESQYKQTNSVVSLPDQTETLVTSLASLEEQERALSAQLQEAKARDSSLQRTTDTGTLKNTYAAVRTGQDEEIKSLRVKLAELEAEVAISRSRLKENHPVLLNQLEQRNSVRALYTQKLSGLLPNNSSSNPSNIASDEVSQELATKLILNETERSGLESKLAVVRSDRAELQTRLTQLPLREQALAGLTRQRTEAASSVELLQRKLEEARIAEAQLPSNISIIDKALPPAKSNWPSKPIVLIIAIAAGTILTIGIMLLLELLDNTLRNATEAEQLVKLPVLGVLPILPTTSLSLKKSEPFLNDSGLVESYRKLLKTMEFRSLEDLRVVVVSSTLSGEGKSAVVSHLAAVSAMLSRRTLIIDADLRRPTQHKVFNLKTQPGLTDVINRSVTLAQAVQPTDIENLLVLTCGQPCGRPSQFLESARMSALLAEAAAQYDLVIVDTPPVTSCVDATTLSCNSDGLLLITRPNVTQRDILLQAVSDLNANKVRILGITVNGINTQTEKYYRYAIEGYQPSKQVT